jgi:hypothetical protein
MIRLRGGRFPNTGITKNSGKFELSGELEEKCRQQMQKKRQQALQWTTAKKVREQ